MQAYSFSKFGLNGPGKYPNTFYLNLAADPEIKSSIVEIQKEGFHSGNGYFWMLSTLDYSRLNLNKEKVQALETLVSLKRDKKLIYPLMLPRDFLKDMDPIFLSIIFNLTESGFANVVMSSQNSSSLFHPCSDSYCSDEFYFAEKVRSKKDYHVTIRKSVFYQFFFVNFDSYNVITCDGVHLLATPVAIIAPFDLYTWILIICVLIILIVILKGELGALNSFSYVIGSMLFLPVAITRRNKLAFFFVYLFIPCFMILSTAYRGRLLNLLFKVSKYESTYKKFEDLNAFYLYSSDKNGFFTRSFALKSYGFENTPMSGFFSVIFNDKVNGNVDSLSEEVREILTRNLNSTTANGLELLEGCNKSAYAASNYVADDELRSGNKLLLEKEDDFVPFMKGTDKFNEHPVMWRVSPHFGNLLVRKMEAVMESGIYNWWEKWILNNQNYKDEIGTWKPVKLQEQTLYFFVVWFVGLGFSSWWFCCELYK